MHTTHRNATIQTKPARRLAMILLAITTVFSLNGVALDTAVAGKLKLARKSGKLILKGIGRAGKAASKSKHKWLRKAGRALQKGAKKGSRKLDNISRAGTRAIRSTKLGRKTQKAWRNAGRWKTKQLNRAFRQCRGRACQLGKTAADFATPF